MTQLVNVEQLSPAQLDFLQQQIFAQKQNLMQLELEKVRDELGKLKAEREIEKQELEIVKHRVDSLDLLNVEGDPRQRLNKMVRKYAGERGMSHQAAWKEFRQNYNTAYRTNLTMLIENYKMKNGIRDITMPEYLMETGSIEDAIRVADKMLNRRSA